MTREQKINWLQNASNEEVMNQFKSSIRTYDKGFAFDTDNLEDLELVEAEILKRMSGK